MAGRWWRYEKIYNSDMRRIGRDSHLYGVFIAGAKPKTPKPVDYTVYVYPDGSAQIKLNSVNEIIQTHEDLIVDDLGLKAGTIILPGNGDPVYYNYPRHNTVLN